MLEAITGRDFLPRGSGMVTRCPIVLQLKKINTLEAEDCGEFLHRPGEYFYDFDAIKNEIVA